MQRSKKLSVTLKYFMAQTCNESEVYKKLSKWFGVHFTIQQIIYKCNAFGMTAQEWRSSSPQMITACTSRHLGRADQVNPTVAFAVVQCSLAMSESMCLNLQCDEIWNNRC